MEAPESVQLSATYRRSDGTSVFTRPGEDRYTHEAILHAERRLLDATTANGPSASAAVVDNVVAQPLERGETTVTLAEDQRAAVGHLACSGQRLDVLVGPAGTGKTATMLALARAWQATHGPASVRGLAPSATAAAELSAALGVPCENTAKWLHESVGAGAERRRVQIRDLESRLDSWARRNPPQARAARDRIAALRAEQARWELTGGDLAVIDEASLAGTHTLDALVSQAGLVGAKVVLVGDDAQLSAVDAGGAFGLLASRTRPAMLTSLWRFHHPWEAGATLRLRVGDRRVIDEYRDHGRIHAGASEAMLEDAYAAWQGSEAAGRSSVLVAASQAHVDALNLRAHNDRVAEGRAAEHGILTRTGTVIGRGDRIVTRRNERAVTTADGGHVRNGALWDVHETRPDGALVVTPAHHVAPEDLGSVVVLPRAYAYDDVELGYATTTHRAQGITVDDAHVLASASMTREHLYVAMTRGRDLNQVFVVTDDVDPVCEQMPDPNLHLGADERLEQILATSSAERAATRVIADNLEESVALRRLEPIAMTIEREVRHGLAPSEPTPVDGDLLAIEELIARRMSSLAARVTAEDDSADNADRVGHALRQDRQHRDQPEVFVAPVGSPRIGL